MQSIAIIPARGGSKGIPKKNIVDLCGNPLIYYTIDVAKASGIFDKIIVSTDDIEIAEYSLYLGAEVPFLRPKHISGDYAPVGDSIEYTLNRLKKNKYSTEIHCVLYPTHPFRNITLLKEMFELALKGYKEVKTFKNVLKNQYYTKISENKVKKFEKGNYNYYRPYGLISYHREKPTKSFYSKIIKDPIKLIDIDTNYDLQLANYIIKNNIFDFYEWNIYYMSSTQH